ncbi:MAG: hypothetical protein LC799_07540 [Actinobacteria bacterium]|nr:hypothetical protein [Actinomycetota bacterium]
MNVEQAGQCHAECRVGVIKATVGQQGPAVLDGSSALLLILMVPDVLL